MSPVFPLFLYGGHMYISLMVCIVGNLQRGIKNCGLYPEDCKKLPAFSYSFPGRWRHGLLWGSTLSCPPRPPTTAHVNAGRHCPCALLPRPVPPPPCVAVDVYTGLENTTIAPPQTCLGLAAVCFYGCLVSVLLSSAWEVSLRCIGSWSPKPLSVPVKRWCLVFTMRCCVHCRSVFETATPQVTKLTDANQMEAKREILMRFPDSQEIFETIERNVDKMVSLRRHLPLDTLPVSCVIWGGAGGGLHMRWAHGACVQTGGPRARGYYIPSCVAALCVAFVVFPR
jgi:hypothetical protein